MPSRRFTTSSDRLLSALELPQRITCSLETCNGLPALGCLSNHGGGRSRRGDWFRLRLERLGVSERLPPEVLREALCPPPFTQFSGWCQPGLHSFRGAFQKHLPTRFVNPFRLRLPFDEEEPLRSAASRLVTNGAGGQDDGITGLVSHGGHSPLVFWFRLPLNAPLVSWISIIF